MVLSFSREKSPLYTPLCNMAPTSQEGFGVWFHSLVRSHPYTLTPLCNMGPISHEGYQVYFHYSDETT